MFYRYTLQMVMGVNPGNLELAGSKHNGSSAAGVRIVGEVWLIHC